MCAVSPTTSRGKTSLIPKTAISTPTVRKIFCQKGLIRLSTDALTTALSNDNEISRTDRIATTPNPVGPQKSPAAINPMTVMAKDHPKVRRNTGGRLPFVGGQASDRFPPHCPQLFTER